MKNISFFALKVYVKNKILFKKMLLKLKFIILTILEKVHSFQRMTFIKEFSYIKNIINKLINPKKFHF
jgi:hypothetical protein